jgi:hypothetical protein
MSLYSAQNVTVKVGANQIFASSATATATKSVEAVRTLGNLLAQGTITSGPVETTISLEYYLRDSSDPIKSIADSILSNPLTYASSVGTAITIGQAVINKCFLTSYSVSAESNSLVTASASFISYGKEQNLNIGQNNASSQALNYKFAHGGGSNSSLVAKATAFTYECNFEFEPIILMGKQGEPEQGLLFNGGTQSLNVRGIGAGGLVTYCTQSQTASASVGTISCGGGNSSLTFTITNGDITSSEVNASVGGFQEGSLTITKQL